MFPTVPVKQRTDRPTREDKSGEGGISTPPLLRIEVKNVKAENYLSGFAHGLLRQACAMDSEYPSEQINSLYFDTSDLDRYARPLSGDFQLVATRFLRINWIGSQRLASIMG